MERNFPRADLEAVIAAKNGLERHTSDHPALDIPEEKHEKFDPEVIGVGSTVVVEYLGDNPKYMTVVLVDSKEDFTEQDGLVPIAPDSSLAKSIEGKTVSDEEISTGPAGRIRIKIINVTNPEKPE